MSQTVVDIPGLPDGVEVRRSTRRRRSVTAFREDGRTVVVVPHRMSRAEIVPYVEELVGRLAQREGRGRRTDSELQARAALLSRRHLEGRAVPSSVRWVGNQRRRWGRPRRFSSGGCSDLRERCPPAVDTKLWMRLRHTHLTPVTHGARGTTTR